MGVCSKCGGSGNIPEFHKVQGGVCFTCNGSGRVGVDGNRINKHTQIGGTKIGITEKHVGERGHRSEFYVTIEDGSGQKKSYRCNSYREANQIYQKAIKKKKDELAARRRLGSKLTYKTIKGW